MPLPLHTQYVSEGDGATTLYIPLASRFYTSAVWGLGGSSPSPKGKQTLTMTWPRTVLSDGKESGDKSQSEPVPGLGNGKPGRGLGLMKPGTG